MPRFKMHERVRVAQIMSPKTNILKAEDGRRPPRIGDTGYVVDIYNGPHEAFCVEGIQDEELIWLSDFIPEEIESVEERNR